MYGISTFWECSLWVLAVNKLTADKMQSIFHLIAEYSTFIEYSLNRLD